ncbi:MAG: indole-3-glycerol-phosphate synthase [Alphaproteobacteria bacterium CG11_big_fil_rev_8_21_14_0_20_39_49]|nr:MAG: indole-3-glycerol-phosphate synthase [Alphaproteobacteria bacterium CG11_big_fil_rev_8_21_14_0_20_39_49]
MSSHDINESDDNLKINDDEESDYEQIASETNHVPEDRIDIISEDNKAAGKVKKKTKVDNTDIEIVNLEHEEIVQDELADEYDSEENQEQEISIITDKIEIAEDEADVLAEHTGTEVESIIKESGDVLSKICEDKKIHIKSKKALISEEQLLEKIKSLPETRGFVQSIISKIQSGENALIGEAKKASPSKGLIRHNFDPSEIAKAYEQGGATCISVLTDEHYFQGNDEYIKIVKDACKLPVLRKDFILDKYQVVESRAIGADCILLIMAVLNVNKAIELEEKAIELGLGVLIEVHDEQDLKKALKLKSDLIGINNRNLKTMEVDLANTERLAPLMPDEKVVVSESGILGYADIIRMNESRVWAFLVGDSIMSQPDVKLATQGLLGNVE